MWVLSSSQCSGGLQQLAAVVDKLLQPKLELSQSQYIQKELACTASLTTSRYRGHPRTYIVQYEIFRRSSLKFGMHLAQIKMISVLKNSPF